MTVRDGKRRPGLTRDSAKVERFWSNIQAFQKIKTAPRTTGATSWGNLAIWLLPASFKDSATQNNFEDTKIFLSRHNALAETFHLNVVPAC